LRRVVGRNFRIAGQPGATHLKNDNLLIFLFDLLKDSLLLVRLIPNPQ
jgi:hypothetical protein